ncbi:MAG: MBOAT family protein [Clostridia bacterium]|nr:MBOAT family protein [Clostridia bacterium]
MLFNSWEFAVFFPIVFILYYLLPHRFRWMLLLGASYYFYMSWNPKLVVLIGFVTLATYFAGAWIGKDAHSGKSRKAALLLGTLIPVLLLFTFKYFDFFSGELNTLFERIAIPLSLPMLDLVLPVGISFYTFQALSYVIDVYRGDTKAEFHLGYYALFISFFPQLVAGPIERSGNLLPQFREMHTFDYGEAMQGIRRMAIGFFKKLLVADLISMQIDPVFASVTGWRGFPLLIGAVLFAFQIYCDFSGYSDIAIGCAQILGFRLMKNFKAPYLATSIKDFWRRWHISLTTWFTDYIYIPLGGSRRGLGRHLANLMIVFAVSGLWHGANWTFIAWGLLHGIYSVLGALNRRIPRSENWKTRMEKPAFRLVRTLFTFGLVCIAWVFFRAETIQDAFYILRYCLEGLGAPIRYLVKGYGVMNFRIDGLIKPLIGILLLILIDIKEEKTGDAAAWLGRQSGLKRWAISLGFVLLMILLSNKGIPSEFIYFQF